LNTHALVKREIDRLAAYLMNLVNIF